MTESPHGPGVISVDEIGKERYAHLSWRKVTVTERVPLHYWKMAEGAKEVETRRIVGKLIDKMRKYIGKAPAEIIGEQELQ